MKHHTDIIGYGTALCAVFLWSLNVLIAQRFATALTPVEFAFGRWVCALLILAPIGGRGVWQARTYFYHHWKWVVGLALSGIVLDNTLIYLAAQTVQAVDLSLLNLLGPIFLTVLVAVVLHHPVGSAAWVGMTLAVAGVMIILTNGAITHIGRMPLKIGILWMIINAFCFAVYSFLQYRRPPFMSQTALLTMTVGVGVVILAPWFGVRAVESRFVPGLTDWAIFVYLGVFNSVLAYLAWNSALARIGAIKTGVIYYLQPVFSIIGAACVFGSRLTWAQGTGGVLVLIGVIIVNRYQRSVPPVVPPKTLQTQP